MVTQLDQDRCQNTQEGKKRKNLKIKAGLPTTWNEEHGGQHRREVSPHSHHGRNETLLGPCINEGYRSAGATAYGNHWETYLLRKILLPQLALTHGQRGRPSFVPDVGGNAHERSSAPDGEVSLELFPRPEGHR